MDTRLITKDDRLYLQIDSTEDSLSSPRKALAGWESFNGFYWFQTEPADEDGDCFGFVQMFEDEWCYFNIPEIESVRSCWKIEEHDLPHAGRRSAAR